ncbi:hypothetical protein [Ruegeria sp. HKCCD8929]|uniref:hypothetical protein n=1 Tax=Ruegeria sp. HKCCD8929 TaxID=2683006 RepID=UPI0014882A9B|nr:hypothetical protein [Ruegeria sp. HKCCD8929]
MSGWLLWIAGGIVILVVAAALFEAYLKRNAKRPLSEMRPEPDEISKVAGIERYGLDPVALAQAEHRRLEEEGWVKDLPNDETSAATAREKETKDERS